MKTVTVTQERNFNVLISFILSTPTEKYCYYPHLTTEETEAQEG